MKKMLQAFLAISFFGIAAFVGNATAAKQEAVECSQWQNESRFPTFYATSWQVSQCATYHVDLSSFVK